MELESNIKVKPEMMTKLNKMASGHLQFTNAKENKIKMTSAGKTIFPVAVQAHRIQFSKGVFRGLKLVTDRDMF